LGGLWEGKMETGTLRFTEGRGDGRLGKKVKLGCTRKKEKNTI